MIEQSEKNLVQIKILNSFLPAISREDLTAVGGKAHEVDSRSIGPPTKSAGVRKLHALRIIYAFETTSNCYDYYLVVQINDGYVGIDSEKAHQK